MLVRYLLSGGAGQEVRANDILLAHAGCVPKKVN